MSRRSVEFLVGVAGLAALAVGAATLSAGDTRHAATNAASPPTYVATGATGVVPAALAARFSDLRRPATSTDSPPADVRPSVAALGSGPGTSYGVISSAARLIGAPGATKVWLVPGATGSCIVISQGSSACGPNGKVETQGLMLALVPTDGAPAVVTGVLPDGASITSTDTGGLTHSVELTGRAYSMSAMASSGFTIKQADGHDLTESLPGGAPPPAP
jgi:hypothetical protein